MPGAPSTSTRDRQPTCRSINLSDPLSVTLTLKLDDVHLWHATLDDRLVDRLEPLLSEDERMKAERFRFDKDRNRYIVARGLLRTILASYLHIGPPELRFSYADKGKPNLEHSDDNNSLKFNLAHSHEMAIYAISRGRELGVDLEFVRGDLADESVAERFFSPTEVAALRALSPDVRRRAFFNCWTRKEAYIKARGEGLSMPLNQFDVSFAPDAPAVLLKNHADPNEVSRWSMQAVPMGPAYIAALVVEGFGWRLSTFHVKLDS